MSAPKLVVDHLGHHWGAYLDPNGTVAVMIVDEFEEPAFSEVKCECGSESIGGKAHSPWCPKFT